ncbi:WD40 repeat domain-containing protein [Archangium lansingense]|uniref:WD40 repeat domain-containing protein n=1 Tax=Archangium lansingense TaxID=2995310 RepID=A0ABT4A6U9_9BACT|nr:WD40 repeat domain-containing protein [Archangium lansinium]MCY1077378.1 WD40 repeat domain-containing protein [Archangium lansinium]
MPAGVTAGSPRFSPDGQRLSFDYSQSNEDSLAVVDRDGKNLQVLATGCTTFCESAWHPTSGEIYFATDDGVNAVAATGGTPRLVHEPFGFVSSVDVSPDGKYLLFDAFDPVLFALADSSEQELPTDDNVYALRFSPDGKKMLYHDYSTHSLRVRELATGATTTVLDTDNYLTGADWFPDGKRLAVISDEGLEILTLQDGAEPVRQMVKSGRALKDVDVSPDGTAIAYCVNGMRSIFVLTGF